VQMRRNGVNPMNDVEHQELLAQVASLYYEKELSQVEIGDQLGLSRIKVYRLLKEARDEQVVQILIMWPSERDIQLEAELTKMFHLDKALVIKNASMTYDTAQRRLGQLVAQYLESTLKDGMTLTVNMGQSTYEVINAIRPGFQANVNVAQAMGSVLDHNGELDSLSHGRQLAQKLGGKFFNLPSPLMANSPEAALVLKDQPLIEHVLNISRHADIALLGIGGLNPESSHYVNSGIIPVDKFEQLSAEGAVGDISGKFIDINGRLLDCVYNQCIIGLNLDELREIPNTIAVALGEEKILAILGSLRTGVINTFCTDNHTANNLIRLNR
jgi:deoxyribonucleoside regulator